MFAFTGFIKFTCQSSDTSLLLTAVNYKFGSFLKYKTKHDYIWKLEVKRFTINIKNNRKFRSVRHMCFSPFPLGSRAKSINLHPDKTEKQATLGKGGEKLREGRSLRFVFI